ncbi:MAG: hypothetical protein SNJ52_02400, partial [Verrucomicrobiia bacterium]
MTSSRSVRSAEEPSPKDLEGDGRLLSNTGLVIATHLVAIVLLLGAGRGCSPISLGGPASSTKTEEVTWLDPAVFEQTVSVPDSTPEAESPSTVRPDSPDAL